MKSVLVILAALGSMALTTAAGCGRPRTPNEAAADLASRDVDTRRDAAAELTERPIAPEVYAPLVRAARAESDPETADWMLAALARTGTPEARATIESRLGDPNAEIREAAAEALRDWYLTTGQLPGDTPTPATFGAPYPGAPESSSVYVGIEGTYAVPPSGGYYGPPNGPAVTSPPPARRPATPTRAPRR